MVGWRESYQGYYDETSGPDRVYRYAGTIRTVARESHFIRRSLVERRIDTNRRNRPAWLENQLGVPHARPAKGPAVPIYFGNRVAGTIGANGKEIAREEEEWATAGWTNSIVAGRLTAIGQKDIFSYQV